jgi:hypothetical protein
VGVSREPRDLEREAARGSLDAILATDRPLARVSQLQRAAGNRAVSSRVREDRVIAVAKLERSTPRLARSSVSQSRGPSAARLLQRMVQITFDGPKHELEPFDRASATILTVRAERGSELVAVEDEYPGSQHRAHVTSHTVLTQMLTRDLPGRNWAQAWTLLHSRYLFLNGLLKQWYTITTKLADVNKTNMKMTFDLIEEGIKCCNQELYRGMHSIAKPLWGARPTDGGPESWVWYDCDPVKEKRLDPKKHLVVRWEPSLMSGPVKKLEEECEKWISVRSRFPWTSVDATSYISGDVTGPDAVEKAAAGAVEKAANPSGRAADPIERAAGAVRKSKTPFDKADADLLGSSIVQKFDFFPGSLNKARTSSHAAVLAARHLVEHFQYHASIDPKWYPLIKDAFLSYWQRKVKDEVKAEKTKTRVADDAIGGKGKAPKLGRETKGLEDLLSDWPAVVKTFDNAYKLFVESIVRG